MPFPPPPLGSVQSFAVLGGSGVVGSGRSRFSGNVGVSPGKSISGITRDNLVVGDIFIDDATARQAQRDAAAAYAKLAALSPCTPLKVPPPGSVGLGPGAYCVTSPLPSPLMLNGNATAVWIFQVKGSLATLTASSVLLSGGATYNNVFWQVDGSVTLGERSAFVGTILARGDITLKRDVSVSGRLLSQAGVVTLDTDDVSCCDPIEFTPASLPDGKVGVSYSPTLTLSGGMEPYQVSLFDGALPPGVTPTLSGAPTAEGTYTFTLLAVDARGCSSIHTYTTTVCNKIDVIFNPMPNPKACVPFKRKISATGGMGSYTFHLPDGLSICDDDHDSICGTLDSPGCAPITIGVTDALGCTGSLTVNLCVDCGLTLPPLNPPTATTCTPYNADLTPSCGKPPYVFTAIVPPWLSSPNPFISGTPPAPGGVTFTVKVTDANGCSDMRTYTLNVFSPPNVSPVPPPPTLPKIVLPTGVVCTPYDSGPLAGVLNSGSLPPGLAFVNSSLQGVPAQCGTFCFKRKIPNPAPCTPDLQEYCITIVLPPLTLQPLAPLQGGVPTNQTLTPQFCIPFKCSVTGTLPSGVALDDCVLHGPSPQPSAFNFCVTATADECPVITRCYQEIVSACGGSLRLSPPSTNLPGGMVGAFYSQAFTASNGTPPYTYIVPAPPAPPPGLTLNQSTGVLSGVPTTPGRYNFTVRASDAAGACDEHVYSIVIGPVPPTLPPIPTLSRWAMLLLAMAIVGVAIIRRSS
jgi:hypothetical protein